MHIVGVQAAEGGEKEKGQGGGGGHEKGTCSIRIFDKH